MTNGSLARALAAAGFAVVLAIAAAAPAPAQTVCDAGSVEDGSCDPGVAAGTGTGGAAVSSAGHDLPVDAIRQIVREYLLEHPELLVEMQQALRTKEEAEEEERSRQAIARLLDRIFSVPEAPVAGNPEGAITLVEFFDYRCGYCRRVKPTLEALLAENDDLRFVFKEFPILGPESTLAARASRAQGLYEPFHWALMGAEGPFDLEHILGVARSVGLDDERLARDMEDAALAGLIEQNAILASALGVAGP